MSLIFVKSYKAKNFIWTMSVVVFRDLEFTHLVSKSMLHLRLLPRNPPIRPWHHDTTRVWDNTTYVYTISLGALPAPTSSWRPFGPLNFVLHALRALRPCDPRINVHDAYIRYACIYDASIHDTCMDDIPLSLYLCSLILKHACMMHVSMILVSLMRIHDACVQDACFHNGYSWCR